MRVIDADALIDKLNKHNSNEWGQRICYCGYPAYVPNNEVNSFNTCRKRKNATKRFRDLK